MAANAGRVIPTPLGQTKANLCGSTIFQASSSQRMTRTPSWDSSRTQFTISFWVRHLEHTATWPIIFGADTSSNNRNHIRMNGGLLQVFFLKESDGAYALRLFPKRSFRDHHSWTHVCVAVDTTNNTSTERGKLWINGVLQIGDDLSSTAVYPDQNYQFAINNTVEHNFCRRAYDNSNYFTGQLSEFYLVDGAAHPATTFAFEDPLTGAWRPIRRPQNVGVNNGTVWSSLGTLSSGGWDSGRGLDMGFNGKPGSAHPAGKGAQSSDNQALLTLDLSSNPITVKNHITIASHTGYTQRIWVTVDGTETAATPAFGQYEFDVSGSLTQIKVQNDNSGGRTYVQRVNIDGVNLVDNAIPGGAWDWIWFGTNGFYIPFDGTGFSADGTAGNVGEDQSGRQNHYTASNTPTFTKSGPSGVSNRVDEAGNQFSNYATWNKNDIGSTVTLSNGNITHSSTTYASTLCKSTIGMKTGKYYWEYKHTQKPSGGWTYMGITDAPNARVAGSDQANDLMYKYSKAWSYNTDGSVTHDDAETSYGAGWSNGDIIGCAFDADSGRIWFSKNGTWQNSGNPETGANPAYSDITTGETYVVGTSIDSNTGTGIGDLISGAQGFNYTPPTGFFPMCSNNNSVGDFNPSGDFKSVAYLGNNSTNNISCGFQPDLVWIKPRQSAYSHQMSDSVRGRSTGTGNPFFYARTDTNATPYQYGNSEGFHSIYGDGFTMFGSSGSTNYTGHKFLAICWKAGGGNIAGSDGDEFWKDGKQYASAALAGVDAGSVNPTASSVGTAQGLSIVQFTATGANMTIAHGLSKAPEFFIVKGNYDWGVYHKGIHASPEEYFANLNENTARVARSTTWQDTKPSSTVVTLGTDINVNESAAKTLMLCWHSVPGLSAFGKYVGNGNANGPYIPLGFKPGFVMVKKANGGENWQMHTSAQNPFNDASDGAGIRVFANTDAAENTQFNFDFYGDGLKVKTTDASVNSNGEPYMYMIWGDEASQGQHGVQATGR